MFLLGLHCTSRKGAVSDTAEEEIPVQKDLENVKKDGENIDRISDHISDVHGNGEVPVLDGCPIFPADNPWNTDISLAEVDPNSDAIIANIGLDRGIHPDFGTVWEGAPIGIPYVIVPQDQPGVNVTFDYADESDPGPYPIPNDPPIEGGPDSEGDRHIIILQSGACKLFELFEAWPQTNNTWNAGSGAVFDLKSNTLRPDTWTSADAAGLAILPGLVKYDEVFSGEVNHAFRFTVSKSRKAFVHPATHWASSNESVSLPPMGMRVRLKANFDITPFPKEVQVILIAMKRYGMMVADNGSDWYLSGSPDSRWNDEALATLKNVHGQDFEVIKMEKIYTPADF
jgi:hypothetical protein